MQALVKELLKELGEDPDRPGLVETPKRVAAAYDKWFGGYLWTDQMIEDELGRLFDAEAQGVVTVTNCPIYSHCEHHMAPFFGTATIQYKPHGKVIGLSKIPRLVDIYSRRLQVQERLTQQIAKKLLELTKADWVDVTTECRHMCIESRGYGNSATTCQTRVFSFSL